MADTLYIIYIYKHATYILINTLVLIIIPPEATGESVFIRVGFYVYIVYHDCGFYFRIEGGDVYSNMEV